MRHLSTLALAVGLVVGLSATRVVADWVELANDDVINGDIISLDAESLKLKSANFGEMTIPRNKVSLIGLGQRPRPTPANNVEEKGQSPLSAMGDAQINRLLQQAFGGGGANEMQQQMNKTKDGLKALRRDLGSTPEAEAIDSYIQIFDLLGSLAPQTPPARATPPKPKQPPQAPAPQGPPPTANPQGNPKPQE